MKKLTPFLMIAETLEMQRTVTGRSQRQRLFY